LLPTIPLEEIGEPLVRRALSLVKGKHVMAVGVGQVVRGPQGLEAPTGRGVVVPRDPGAARAELAIPDCEAGRDRAPKWLASTLEFLPRGAGVELGVGESARRGCLRTAFRTA
jgi:hypothetical protein